uniref:CASP-like protein n=1 Tax=Kalanchoe fedtschenkoi TaxID=63787 RepID=A0A7N0TK34_KALFE
MPDLKMIHAAVLRLLALGATVAAVVVMVTSHETATVLNMKFTAKYNNTEAFMYFVVANAVASGYSLIVLLLPCKSLCWRIILILDVVMVVLLASSMSAALAIAQVGKKGNSHAGWLPICGQVPRFCDHVGGAIISGIAGSSLYLVLLLHSIYNVLGSAIFSLKP